MTWGGHRIDAPGGGGGHTAVMEGAVAGGPVEQLLRRLGFPLHVPLVVQAQLLGHRARGSWWATIHYPMHVYMGIHVCM